MIPLWHLPAFAGDKFRMGAARSGGHDSFGHGLGQGPYYVVIHDVRLPRSITALLAGAALGIAGLQMQTLFRNPLADPYALGIASGASLGVALVLLTSGATVSGVFGSSLGLAGDALVTAASIAGAAWLSRWFSDYRIAWRVPQQF